MVIRLRGSPPLLLLVPAVELGLTAACFAVATLVDLLSPATGAGRLPLLLGGICSLWTLIAMRWIERREKDICLKGPLSSKRRPASTVRIVTTTGARTSTVRLMTADELPAEAQIIATHIDVHALHQIANQVGTALGIPVDTSQTS